MPSKRKSQSNPEPLEIIAFILAGFYMQSVLTVAHHAAFRVRGEAGGVVESPAVPILVVGTLLVIYNCYKEKRLGILNAVTLTVLVTSSIFWLSGLRANFFF